jgi:hypothetical protein
MDFKNHEVKKETQTNLILYSLIVTINHFISKFYFYRIVQKWQTQQKHVIFVSKKEPIKSFVDGRIVIQQI